MKKVVIVLILISLNFNTIIACDVCGANMGIIPNEKLSFLGITYRYSSITGDAYKGNQRFPSETNRVMHGNAPVNIPNGTYELYKTIDFRGRYFLHPRFQLDFILPYGINSEGNSTISNTINGIGDLSLFGAWEAFSHSDCQGFRDRFQIGGGFKLATGNYKNEIDGERADPLLQTGTDTNDFFGLVQYSGIYKYFGLYINSAYKINTTNSYNERVGNSLNSFFSLFYRFDINQKLKVLPNFQTSYEYTNGLYINSTLQNGTTMNVFMIGVGVDMLYKTIGLNFGAQLPVYEAHEVNGIESRLKCMGNLTWILSQSKFPLLK